MPIPIDKYIRGLPKAELHLHIEGTFEPALMFEIAQRNKINIKHETVEELRSAYNFSDLQDFLNIYYQGTGVLRQEQDFYDMAFAYFKKARAQNVLHAEIFFDPQTHTRRGIEFKTMINGIHRALADAEKELGLSVKLIMSFLRDIAPASALQTLREGLLYKDWIVGVGLDSAEAGHPPASFEEVFKEARANGFLAVAHAGEEGPAEYVW